MGNVEILLTILNVMFVVVAIGGIGWAFSVQGKLATLLTKVEELPERVKELELWKASTGNGGAGE